MWLGGRRLAGVCVCVGRHLIRTWSKHQKVTALSSAEAELYAVVTGSCEGLGIKAYGDDLGIKLHGNVYTDSSAALGILQRTGVGRINHIHTQALWLQEARESDRLGFRKVKGEDNPADLLTKYLAKATIIKHCEFMGARFEKGRASTAPSLNVLNEIDCSSLPCIPQELLMSIDAAAEGESQGKNVVKQIDVLYENWVDLVMERSPLLAMRAPCRGRED